jgi:hypothetical protein
MTKGLFNAKTKENFLTKEEVELFLKSIEKTEAWEESSVEFWNKRVINSNNVMVKFGKELDVLLVDITNRVKEFITKEYGLGRGITPDIVTICRWFPGMEQPPHADDMTNTEFKELAHRVFGSIIYLYYNYTCG